MTVREAARAATPSARTARSIRGISGFVDGRRALFASNIAFGTVLALYFAFLVDLDHTFWAMLTLPFVLQQQSGLSVWRSLGRVMGTILGAIVGLILLAVFAQDGVAIIVALSLWLLAAGFLARFEMGTDAYPYGIAGVTAVVIVLDAGPDAGLAFDLAVARGTETVIPIVAGLMIVLVVFPQSVIPLLRGSIATARSKIAEIARLSVGRDGEPAPPLRREAAQALRSAFTNLRAGKFEASSRHGSVPRLRSEAHRLNEAITAAEALNFVLDPYRGPDALPARIAEARAGLDRLVRDLPGAESTAAAALVRADRLRDYADGLGLEETFDALGPDPASGAIEEASTLFRMHRLATALAEAVHAGAASLDPKIAFDPVAPGTTRHTDVVEALQIGGRAAIAFLAVAMFWIASGWETARIVALITGILALQLPTNAPRASLPSAGGKLALGLLAMAPITLLVMAILPSMDSFLGFAALIWVVIFVLFYLCGAPQNLAVGYGGVIILSIGLQPSNMQVYAPILLFNVAATLAMVPVVITAVVLIFFPSTPARLRARLAGGTDALLRRAARQKLTRRDFLAQNIDLLADYGGDLDMDDPVNRHHIERTRAAALVGSEVYALRGGDPGAVLPGAAGRLTEAAIAASRLSASDAPEAELRRVAEIRDEAHARLATVLPGDRPALHRLLSACHLVTALIDQRRLSLPEAAP